MAVCTFFAVLVVLSTRCQVVKALQGGRVDQHAGIFFLLQGESSCCHFFVFVLVFVFFGGGRGEAFLLLGFHEAQLAHRYRLTSLISMPRGNEGKKH